MRQILKLFKRKKKHNVSGVATTAGIDIDGRYSITIQEIDDIPCLCVHKCEIKGGLHGTTMNEKSFLIGIPIRPILEMCNSCPWLIKKEE